MSNESTSVQHRLATDSTLARVVNALEELPTGLQYAKDNANNAANRANTIAEQLEDMEFRVNTLQAGQNATISKSVDPNTGDITLTFGIPRGADGQDGERVKIHICSSSEYDHTTYVPTIQNPDNGAIYLVPSEDAVSTDMFVEWIYADNGWEKFGSAKVDLTEYVKSSDISVVTRNGNINIGHGGLSVLSFDGVPGMNVRDRLILNTAQESEVKAGTQQTHPLTPSNTKSIAFYGLAKAAGDTTQSQSNNPVGTYTDDAKAAIKQMLDIPESGEIFLVTFTPTEEEGRYTADKTFAETEEAILSGKTVVGATLYESEGDKREYSYYPLYYSVHSELHPNHKTIEFGNAHDFIWLHPDNSADRYSENVATLDDYAGIGTTWATWSADKISRELANAGTVQDVQVNGVSVLSGGVANVPIASISSFGVIKMGNAGVSVDSDGILRSLPAGDSSIKGGTTNYNVIVPRTQHQSTFYGLAKAAGDATQSASSNAVGQYTDNAKSAIQTMLGVEQGVSFVETVSGTAVNITGIANARYVCGTVATISITPPATGTIDVLFSSGSTAAVLTVPNTVKWPYWFNVTSLDADTTYELVITDGVYGGVMAWAD